MSAESGTPVALQLTFPVVASATDHAWTMPVGQTLALASNPELLCLSSIAAKKPDFCAGGATVNCFLIHMLHWSLAADALE